MNRALDRRILALLAALVGTWLLFAFAARCGEPRPAGSE
jgi:hypothetical protein